MSIRRQPLITGQYYHVYNRGVDKRDIFADKNDLYRFIESIKEFNRVDKIDSLANLHKFKQSLQIAARPLSGVKSKDLLVEIVAYCLNPNHFHLILKQISDDGVSKFMHKLQGGYVSYFNNKNSRNGSLFQGKFKSQIIVDENYFNKLIGYVNKNYLIHNIPENKNQLVFSGDFEYENNKFNIIFKNEGERILEVFGGVNKFKKHCDEIVSIVREERGRKSLLEDEDLDVIIESIPDSGLAAI
jgi:REP element-mobilizing transposase RayT